MCDVCAGRLHCVCRQVTLACVMCVCRQVTLCVQVGYTGMCDVCDSFTSSQAMLIISACKGKGSTILPTCNVKSKNRPQVATKSSIGQDQDIAQACRASYLAKSWKVIIQHIASNMKDVKCKRHIVIASLVFSSPCFLILRARQCMGRSRCLLGASVLLSSCLMHKPHTQVGVILVRSRGS